MLRGNSTTVLKMTQKEHVLMSLRYILVGKIIVLLLLCRKKDKFTLEHLFHS